LFSTGAVGVGCCSHGGFNARFFSASDSLCFNGRSTVFVWVATDLVAFDLSFWW
jgi:hypothetical protein